MKIKRNVYTDIFESNSGRLENTAVIYSGVKTTYGRLFSEVDKAAAALISIGLQSYDRVILRCHDSTAYIILALALLKIEAIQIPLEISAPEAEVKETREQVSANAVISMGMLSDNLLSGAEMKSFTCEMSDIYVYILNAKFENVKALNALNPAFIRFTSGTTSLSKGVIISHESVIFRTDSANEGLKISNKDSVLWVLSMAYHFVVTILLFLRKGAAIAICKSPAALYMPEMLSREKITFLYMSPFHYHLMCESKAFKVEFLEHARLLISTAMPMDITLAEKFHSKFKIRPRQAYGIIEVGLPCVDLDEVEFKSGLVGRILPPCEIQIKDPDKSGTGNILLRSPGMFDGYLNPFTLRNEVCENGFFNAGDVGFIDEKGQLVIMGRSKNIINFAGMKIFPYEIEETIRSYEIVDDISVYAVNDNLYGEVPHADVVFKSSIQSSEQLIDGLRKFCYSRLASYKVPKVFNIRDKLERTLSGKILRRK